MKHTRKQPTPLPANRADMKKQAPLAGATGMDDMGVTALTRLPQTPQHANRGSTHPWQSGHPYHRASGRNRENIDFPNTRLTRVTIDLTSATLSLAWHNPTGLLLPTGPYRISAGAGCCCVDCNDETVSRTSESLCTPKGTFFVNGKGYVLSNTSWAHNPTYFSRAGIAIHAGPLPPYPASHGCVRTEEEASEIIHDNAVYSATYAANLSHSLPERRTEIVVQGTWNGTHCYRTGQTDRVLRSEACTSLGELPLSPDVGISTRDKVP